MPKAARLPQNVKINYLLLTLLALAPLLSAPLIWDQSYTEAAQNANSTATYSNFLNNTGENDSLGVSMPILYCPAEWICLLTPSTVETLAANSSAPVALNVSIPANAGAQNETVVVYANDMLGNEAGNWTLNVSVNATASAPPQPEQPPPEEEQPPEEQPAEQPPPIPIAEQTAEPLTGAMAPLSPGGTPSGSGRVCFIDSDLYPTQPYYQNLTSSGWSSSDFAQDVGGNVYWVVTKSNPKRNETILGTLDAGGDVNVQFFTNNAWTTPTELTATSAVTAYRAFDIAVEQLSGDVMVVYNNGTTGNVSYKIWDGDAWSSGGNIPILGASAAQTNWVKLAARNNSDQMMLVVQPATSTADIYAVPWTGSAWGDVKEVDSNAEITTKEDFDVAYEQSSGDALIVWANSTYGYPCYITYSSGGTWGTANYNVSAAQLASNGGTATIEWVRLAPYPTDDSMMVCYEEGSAADYDCQRWNGGGWDTTGAAIETTGEYSAGSSFRNFDVVPETANGGFLVLYGYSNIDFYYSKWCYGATNCAAGTWAANASIFTDLALRFDTSWVSIAYNPLLNGRMVAVMKDQTGFVDRARLNCSSGASVCRREEVAAALTMGGGQTAYEDAMFAYDQYVPPGCGDTLYGNTKLDQNIRGNSSTCITLGADNIILDCQGYSLTGNLSANVPAILASGRTNITIKNCRITNWTLAVNFSYTNNSYITNTTIYNTTGLTGATGASGNPGATGGAGTTLYGLHFSSSRDNTLTNNTVTNLTGGTGGTGGASAFADGGNGGVGGSVYAFYFDAVSHNNSITNITTSLISGGAGGTGGNGGGGSGDDGGIGGAGGSAESAYILSANNTLHISYLYNITGGAGGNGGNAYAAGCGGNGGGGTVVYISATNGNETISNTTLGNVTGGKGGNKGTSSGPDPECDVYGGGNAFVVYIASRYGTIVNSTITNATGGAAGTGSSATAGSGYGIYLHLAASPFASDHDIINTTISQTSNYDVYTGVGKNNVLLNCTFTRSKIAWSIVDCNTCNLTIKWYFRVNVTDLGGTGLAADVNVSDVNGTSDFSGTAGADGNTSWFIVFDETLASGSGGYPKSFNNHSINASYAGYTFNQTTHNITYSETFNVILYSSVSDYSFTITMPSGTNITEFIAGRCNSKGVNATNQTDAVPAITFTNTGNVDEYYNVSLNDSAPSGTTMYCGAVFSAGSSRSENCNCTGATGSPMSATGYNACCNITTAKSQINASTVAPSGTQTLWCWADFNCSTAPGTYDRDMNQTSFQEGSRAAVPPAPPLAGINTKFALFFLIFAFRRQFIRKV